MNCLYDSHFEMGDLISPFKTCSLSLANFLPKKSVNTLKLEPLRGAHSKNEGVCVPFAIVLDVLHDFPQKKWYDFALLTLKNPAMSSVTHLKVAIISTTSP